MNPEETPAADDVPSFTLKASDPAAPFALLSYAAVVKNHGGSREDVNRVQALAAEFYDWQDTHGITPPDTSDMGDDTFNGRHRLHAVKGNGGE